jgi:hypothetical protein
MQKALDTLRGAAVDALKLGIDARRAQIQQETVDKLDRALALALTEAGVGYDRIGDARRLFAERLRGTKVIEGAG